jgi:hypothetical protein
MARRVAPKSKPAAGDYASGGAAKSPPGNAPPGSPLQGKTEGDLGKYGVTGINPPNKAPERPDKGYRKVAGGGSAGSVQKRSQAKRSS